MATAGFYNQNLYRDYPFCDQSQPLRPVRDPVAGSSLPSESCAQTVLPCATIVDFGAIIRPHIAYDVSEDWIYLHAVRREDPYVLFFFRTTAMATQLVFVVHQLRESYAYLWQESQLGEYAYTIPPVSSSSNSATTDWWLGCGETIAGWEGFLVVGQLTDLLTVLADGETWTYQANHMVIEPARVQCLGQAYVRSLNLANQARTTAIPPAVCYSESSSYSRGGSQDVQDYITNTCLQGELAFKEGYNCQIRQDNLGNAIVISAATGAGAGAVCEEFAYYPGEAVAPGDTYYTGGPTCADVIKTINGVGGAQLQIEGGPGITVQQDPVNRSRLVVSLALDDFAVCPAG
jgi:hypothetical protein